MRCFKIHSSSRVLIFSTTNATKATTTTRAAKVARRTPRRDQERAWTSSSALASSSSSSSSCSPRAPHSAPAPHRVSEAVRRCRENVRLESQARGPPPMSVRRRGRPKARGKGKGSSTLSTTAATTTTTTTVSTMRLTTASWCGRLALQRVHDDTGYRMPAALTTNNARNTTDSAHKGPTPDTDVDSITVAMTRMTNSTFSLNCTHAGIAVRTHERLNCCEDVGRELRARATSSQARMRSSGRLACNCRNDRCCHRSCAQLREKKSGPSRPALLHPCCFASFFFFFFFYALLLLPFFFFFFICHAS